MNREFAILRESLRVTGYDYMCPECLMLLKNVPAIGSHCRDRDDDTHRGLGLFKRKDFPEFLRCYQRAVGWNVILSLKDGPGRNTCAIFFLIDEVLLWKICVFGII
jgi:hypothetical protein